MTTPHQRGHRHGNAMPSPRTKGELARHLIVMHGQSIDKHRWTAEELKENHRLDHQRYGTEGAERA